MKGELEVIIAIVPAKGGSVRLPNKNMHELLGRPLIDYAIEDARKSKLIDAIYVSTDSDEIEKYARSQGVGTIRRGPDLSEAFLLDVYLHALDHIHTENIEYLVGVQADHPDRTMKFDDAIQYTIEKKLDLLTSDDANGVHNGAIYVARVEAMRNKTFKRTDTVIDNCTNVHFAEDLKQAEKSLSRLR